MDRISNLPNEILCHIGSFLSAKEVASTTVLSKRWQNFTKIHTLYFDNSIESFQDFAQRLSSLQANSRVRKLCLKWYSLESDGINDCLLDVLNRGVFDLNLWINGNERYLFPLFPLGERGRIGYSLPFEVFTSKTITKLSLGFRFTIDELPEDALLPSLKTLSLNYLKFNEFGGNCAFQTLLDASPVLEELFLSDVNWEQWKWSRVVSSLSLKRLTIIRTKWDDYNDSEFKSISFDTPGLVYLYYSDYVPKEYLNVNFNSLVEAKINLRRPLEDCLKFHYTDAELYPLFNEMDAGRFYPMNLLHGLKDVEILNLHSIQTLQMFLVFHKELLVFEKLSHLSVSISYGCWHSLRVMVEKSPNLKTLTIDGSLHYKGFERWSKPWSVCDCLSKYSFLESCPLEVLKITECSGTLTELIQMKYILGKLSCLELVQVHYCPLGRSERTVTLLESDLQKLPRASSKCKFQVIAYTFLCLSEVGNKNLFVQPPSLFMKLANIFN